jgi:DinB superfamily
MLPTPYSHLLKTPTLEDAVLELEFALKFEGELIALPYIDTQKAGEDGKWSKKQELGHLIDSALNNHQRFIRAQIPSHLENGVLRISGYQQNDWVQVGEYQSRVWGELVRLWKSLNQQVLHVMKNVAPEALQTPCSIGGGEPITLEFVMVDYVGHLKHHLSHLLEEAQ